MPERPDPLRKAVQALALGDGFQFLVLLAPTPRAADAGIADLVRRLDELQGEPAPLVRVEPYASRSADGMGFEKLADSLTELLSTAADLPAEQPIAIFDGSRARRSDTAAWEAFFRRMNERRNGIVRQLRGPFVLCIPMTLESAFANHAPDFWSIRSGEVVLPEVTAPIATASAPMQRLRRASQGTRRPGGLEAASARVAEARAAFATDTPRAGRRGLMFALLDLAHAAQEAAASSVAIDAYREAAALAREQAAATPRFGQRRELALRLGELATALAAIGRLAESRAALEESLQVRRSLLDEDRTAPERLMGLAVTLTSLAYLEQVSGNLTAATAAQRESVALRREVNARMGDEFALRGLVVGLVGLGTLHGLVGELAPARKAYEEALGRSSEIRKPDPTLALLLAEARSGLGEVLAREGQLDDSYAMQERALAELHALRSDTPDVCMARSVALNRLASLHAVRGDLTQAREFARKAVVETRKATNDRPESGPALASALQYLAMLLLVEKPPELVEARDAIRASIGLLDRAVETDETPQPRIDLVLSWCELALADAMAGEGPSAVSAVRQALIIVETLASAGVRHHFVEPMAFLLRARDQLTSRGLADDAREVQQACEKLESLRAEIP